MKVMTWRLQVLLDAGYPVELAEKLAHAAHVDLHQAVELVTAMCSYEQAAEILL